MSRPIPLRFASLVISSLTPQSTGLSAPVLLPRKRLSGKQMCRKCAAGAGSEHVCDVVEVWVPLNGLNSNCLSETTAHGSRSALTRGAGDQVVSFKSLRNMQLPDIGASRTLPHEMCVGIHQSLYKFLYWKVLCVLPWC